MTAAAIRVLYVDNELSLLETGKLFLERSGDFTITTALSAPEAIRLLELERFDAIISDYQIPWMDGIQFLVEVRTRFGQIPFILLTGRGREEVVIQAINSGADFYLQKGDNPKAQFAELSHKIKQAVSWKKAEDAFKKSEEKYRHLIEHSDEAIVIAQDGMLQLINHRMVEFTGYSEQELLSIQFSAVIHPDDHAMVVEWYQKRINVEESPSRYTFRLSPKDGSTRWIEISVAATDWDGHPATLNFLTDITERKWTEEALLLFGYSAGQHLSIQEIAAKIHPDDRTLAHEALTRVIGTGEPYTIDIWIYRNDTGELRFIHSKGQLLKSEQGDSASVFGINLDVPEQKRAEEELRANLNELTRQVSALRESDEKYRAIYDQSPIAIELYDATGTLAHANPACLNLFGIEDIQAIQNFSLFADPNINDEQKEKLHLGGTVQYQGPFDFEKVKTLDLYPTSREGIIWLDVLITPLRNSADSITGFLVQIQDITERKMMEYEIRSLNRDLEQRVVERTSQLNASLEDKIVLLREVHHRVRNNFQIIISLLNLQSQSIEDEKTQQVFRESQNRVRAIALVHEKLYQSTDIAKIDFDNYIRFLGNSLLQFYGMKGKGIILNTRIQDIHVDINTAIPIGLIVNELVSNSLKFAFPDGGRGEISLAIQRENAILTIMYKDNGIGIPADLDWRNAKSLGLRLVIALVGQLDGTIELDRTMRTTFTIVVKENEGGFPISP
ncbi:MAG: PAS domain S-box protein [Methanoregula sp.]|nr:PAS domain S-box protein [Methanoregula sp.]